MVHDPAACGVSVTGLLEEAEYVKIPVQPLTLKAPL